jgi:hypothetical protein
MSDIQQINTRNPDGAYLGAAATDKLGFWGATPVVQQTAPTAVTGYSITNSSPYGLDSSANMKLLMDAVVAIRLALVNAGIIA